jgi:hypothetical protein
MTYLVPSWLVLGGGWCTPPPKRECLRPALAHMAKPHEATQRVTFNRVPGIRRRVEAGDVDGRDGVMRHLVEGPGLRGSPRPRR